MKSRNYNGKGINNAILAKSRLIINRQKMTNIIYRVPVRDKRTAIYDPSYKLIIRTM